MILLTIIGIMLIAGGVLGLVYTSFKYTQRSGSANLGPVEISLSNKKTVYVPTSVSVAAIGIGSFILLF